MPIAPSSVALWLGQVHYSISSARGCYKAWRLNRVIPGEIQPQIIHSEI